MLNTVRRLTAPVSAAIATIAVQGPDALKLVSQSVTNQAGQQLKLAPTAARFAHWRFRDAALADEHLIVLVRSPDCVELHCHGGMAISEAIIQQLVSAGCEVDTGKDDDQSTDPWSDDQLRDAVSDAGIHSAAQSALQRATTLKAALILLDQYQGALSRDIKTLDALIVQGQRDAATQLCDELLKRAEFGTRLSNPWRLTLAGPPNVGKSSLMNALCGASRVLVHHEPGTTRDAVETKLVIGDWPITLTDTAGIRTTNESIEHQGIQAAWSRWRRADIGLLVVDASVGWTDTHTQLLDGPATVFIALNKVDLVTNLQELKLLHHTIGQRSNSPAQRIIPASANVSGGIEEVAQAIAEYLDGLRPAPQLGVPFNEVQCEWLRRVQRRIQSGSDALPQAGN